MRRASVILLLAARLVTALPAAAQSDAVARENAIALYKAGNDARDAGDMKTAAAKYADAYTLVQTPVIALALGRAERALGKLIEARQTWLGVRNIPVKPHESTLSSSAREESAGLAAEVEPRIPTVTLRIAIPDGAPPPSVTLDGIAIPIVALNAPWKTDPGSHRAVVATEAGTSEAVFNLAEGEGREVPVDYPGPTAAPTAPPPRPEPPPALLTVAPATLPPHAPSRLPAYVAFGVGGAGVVVTSVFGVLALHDRSALNQACMAGKTDCPAHAQSDIDLLHRNAIASDVGLGFAVAGLGAGVALLLFRPRALRSNRSEVGTLRIEPAFGFGAAGIAARF
jgi:hypothetical protein